MKAHFAREQQRWCSGCGPVSRAWLVMLIAAAPLSCAKQPARQDGATSPVDATSPTEEAVLVGAQKGSAAAPLATRHECAERGPLHCNVPSTSDDAGICETLGACLKQQPEQQYVDKVYKVEGCTEISRARLAADSGVDSIALVKLEGELEEADPMDSDNGSGAYLIAIRDGRACPVAEALPFSVHRHGYHEDSLQLRIDPRLRRVHTAARRMEHICLDQEELAADVSDIEWQGCDQYVHLVHEGVLHELRHKDISGPAACEVALAPRNIEPRPPSPTPAAVSPTSCAGAGPIACDLPPSSTRDELCAQIRQCVEERGRSQEWYLSKVTECSAPLQEKTLPGAASLSGSAIVEVSGMHAKKPAHSAYLVARRADGYCLVDQLFDPVAGRPLGAAGYELTWGEAQQELQVSCSHMDRLKLTYRGEAAGRKTLEVSETRTYRVENGAFTRSYQGAHLSIEP